MGGKLEQAAPTLLFPDNRAAIFNTKDMSKLTGLLTKLGLQQNIAIVESEPETMAPYVLERVGVPDLSIPIVKARQTGDYGPFAKQTGSWSVGVGVNQGKKNSVICDRHYTQFIETEWPTRTKRINRRQIGSDHFGSRFELHSSEVAVLRFWTTEQRSSRGVALGMGGAGMLMGSSGMSSGGGLTEFDYSKSKSSQNDSSFPIIIVAYADEQKPDLDLEPAAGWSKPLKTAVLEKFDYDSTARRYGFSGGFTSSSRRGFSSARSAGDATPSRQPPTSKKNTGPPKTSRFIVHSLRHTQAVDALKLVQQLFPAETEIRVIADNRTNSLLVWAADEKQAEVMEILKILDAERPADNPLKATESRKAGRKSVEMEVGPAGVMVLKGSKGSVTAAEQMLKQMSSQQLLDRSKSLQDKAISRAEQYLKDGSAGKDLAALKQTVQEDFDVQQRLQLAEIEFLKARLADLERRVRQKEQLKDRIIDRRIESLLSRPANFEQKVSAEAFKRAETVFKRVEKKSDTAAGN